MIIAGTHNGKVVAWEIQSDSLRFDNGNEVAKVNSILIINSTHLLAGYNGFLIFWSFPEISQINRINSSTFGTIGDMKNLTEENLVLIVNVEAKMIVFSLNNDSIIKVNNIVEQGHSFDILNKSFIFAPCLMVVADDIEYTGLNKILSIDVLNDRIVAGHQNGSISHYNKSSFALIKTFSGRNLSLAINVIKKYIDLVEFQTFINPTTFKNIESSIFSSSKQSNSLTTSSSYNNDFSLTSFSESISILEKITTNQDSTKNVFIHETSFLITTPNNLESTIYTNTFSQYINFNKMSLNEILEYLKNGIDLNNCISNCSGNGYCKLVDNIELICECFKNYAGSQCEINTLPCYLNKCKNNASCINDLQNNTYHCISYHMIGIISLIIPIILSVLQNMVIEVSIMVIIVRIK
ncbi:unnamed protein product [Brachionus calyciflorus]|uniref:EGF-like domain-containing protein n=1 Tax=Brachionus calyciflorus TaxID=104777 RepID=A0A813YLH9_9BILA|nr:unnamed protein product [Brachionus calyciflorus]